MLLKFEDEAMACATKMHFDRAIETDDKHGGHTRALLLVLDVTPYIAKRQTGFFCGWYAKLFHRKPPAKLAKEAKFQLFFNGNDFHCLYDLLTQSMKEAVDSHRDLWRQTENYNAYTQVIKKADEQLLADATEQQKSYS